MLVREAVQVARPYEHVSDALAGPAGWLCAAAAAALGAARAGHGVIDPPPTPAAVSLALSTARGRQAGAVRSFRWLDDGGDGPFRALEGELGVAPLGPGATELYLEGSYELPGPYSADGWQAGGQVVVERTIRRFLEQIAARAEARR